jgi:CRISPR-associated endonuclease/helicase Cas3
LSENELTEMVDIVYEAMDIEGNTDFKNGLNKYTEIQYNRDWIKDLTSDEKVFTREGLDTVTVIPDCFYEKLYDEDNHDELNQYQLNISKKRFYSLHKEEKKVGKHKYIYVDATYSLETGLVFKKKK